MKFFENKKEYKKYEKELERQYQDKDYKLWKNVKLKKMDYCPKCRKRTEHIKLAGSKMCKKCSYQESYF